MSSAGAPAPSVTSVTGTVVWLPLSLPGRRSDTGMSEFLPGQMANVADSLSVSTQEVVSPEVLGMRNDFAARLVADLTTGTGVAIDDFSLLVEGVAYGLLRPETRDLDDHSLSGTRIEDRYLTLLMFKSNSQANETCAGSFAPETLVCPAPRWQEHDTLQQMVLQRRQRNESVAARGLLTAFLAAYGGANSPWERALRVILNRNQGPDPGESHQRNIGAFYLQVNSNAAPSRVFFPVYRVGYLEDLARRLCSESVVQGIDQLNFFHQGHLACSLSRGAHQDPALFGYGCEFGDPGQGGPPSVQLSETALDRLAEISNMYLSGGMPTNPRFELPDCLRYFFWKFGDAAEHLLASASPRYSVYSLCRMKSPFPHETTATPGLYSDLTGHSIFYIEPVAGQSAYYVETFRGKPVGELSALGYVLWLVFSNQATWDTTRSEVVYNGTAILGQRHDRLWILQGLMPVQPDPQRKAAELISFVTAAELQQPSLFQASAESYLGPMYQTFKRSGSVHNTEQILLAGRPWWRIH